MFHVWDIVEDTRILHAMPAGYRVEVVEEVSKEAGSLLILSLSR
jgi:hypothetical protein